MDIDSDLRLRDTTQDKTFGAANPLLKALAVAGLAGAFVALSVFLAEARGIQGTLLMRDPAASFSFPPIAGMISHLGVAVMFGTAAVCAFAAFLPYVATPPLLRTVALFSAFVALDDLFMLHEDAGLLAGALPEYVVFAAYLLFGLGIMTQLLGGTQPGPLAVLFLAGALLAGSMGFDMILPQTKPIVLIEDTLKFMGYVVWALFWTGRARRALRPDPA
ncbi:MAG: hypothetical protein HUJ24_02290 [Rhodobacteraceae bacterium]|nr:hypothetical protein [Paracoccaceae bacterium]